MAKNLGRPRRLTPKIAGPLISRSGFEQLQSCSSVKMRLGASRRSSTWVSTKAALARRFWPFGPLMPLSVPELLSLPPLVTDIGGRITVRIEAGIPAVGVSVKHGARNVLHM